ncbi:MFS transporter, partial [Candidatus Bathyarchaeota archaeon]|nr:MFS transporter [Candidatus Bathyarchaeota archaeon]
VGSAFILANGALVPIWGKLSDIWGRKPVLLAATAVFWLGSLLCGVSVNMAMLIASRAVQGAGGGGIITLVNICISDLFSMRNRGFYFGLVGVVWAIASAIGPVIGGVFTSEVTWRWCFYINLPICGVAMVLMFFTLHLHNPRTPVRKGLAAVDWLGSATIVGGTVMFLLGLEFGGVSHPWTSPTVLCLIIFGLLSVALFCLIEAKIARYPIIPLHLFRDRSNVACLFVSFFHSFVFLSGSYYLPLYFQGVKGLSSLDSGIYLLAYVLPLSLVSALIGFVIRATGNYNIGIVAGLAVMTLGFGLFIDLDADSGLTKMILYQVVAGIGVGPNFQSPLIALQAGVEGRDIASATSTFSFMRQIAGAISVVVGGVVFDNEMQRQHPALVRELGAELADKLSGENAASSVAMVGAMKGEEGIVAKRAFASALQVMYIVYAVFGAAGLVSGFFVGRKKLSRQHTEHKTGLKTLRSREKKK